MVGAGPIRIDERDPRYPALVRGFNQRWVGRPRRVEVCRTTTDVVASVERALQDGLRITVRSGGHCYEDFVSGNDGGVILDLSPLSAVYLDAATGQYCVEAGATLWNAYGRLYKEHGVTRRAGRATAWARAGTSPEAATACCRDCTGSRSITSTRSSSCTWRPTAGRS
jgi:FAD/FMN-containing dehydrogenase